MPSSHAVLSVELHAHFSVCYFMEERYTKFTKLSAATHFILLYAQPLSSTNSTTNLLKAPLLDVVDIPLIDKQMNASLLETKPSTIFRQDPSPELDEAWRIISDIRPIPISRAGVIGLGKDPDRAAKWPEDFGYGPDACIGRLALVPRTTCL